MLINLKGFQKIAQPLLLLVVARFGSRMNRL